MAEKKERKEKRNRRIHFGRQNVDLKTSHPLHFLLFSSIGKRLFMLTLQIDCVQSQTSKALLSYQQDLETILDARCSIIVYVHVLSYNLGGQHMQGFIYNKLFHRC